MKYLDQVAEGEYKLVEGPDVASILFSFGLFIYIIAILTKGVNFQTKKIEIVSPVPEKVYAAEITPTPTKSPSIEELREVRINKTHKYLLKMNSPLAPYATHIVSMADKYDIPWTLVTAIAQKESSLCKYNAGENNCWGITTGKKDGPKFASYESLEKGIEAATKLISYNYRGNMNKAIQEKYCPSVECSDTWVSDVTNFQKNINK